MQPNYIIRGKCNAAQTFAQEVNFGCASPTNHKRRLNWLRKYVQSCCDTVYIPVLESQLLWGPLGLLGPNASSSDHADGEDST